MMGPGGIWRVTPLDGAAMQLTCNIFPANDVALYSSPPRPVIARA